MRPLLWRIPASFARPSNAELHLLCVNTERNQQSFVLFFFAGVSMRSTLRPLGRRGIKVQYSILYPWQEECVRHEKRNERTFIGGNNVIDASGGGRLPRGPRLAVIIQDEEGPSRCNYADKMQRWGRDDGSVKRPQSDRGPTLPSSLPPSPVIFLQGQSLTHQEPHGCESDRKGHSQR